MNLAAAAIAVSLFGIQQDVLTTGSGSKPSEYVIRLNQSDMDTLRDGRQPLMSAIERGKRGGKLYRIYMDEQSNQQAVNNPNPQNVDILFKPSNNASEGVFSIALSAQQLDALESGVVFGGALPTPTTSAVGAKFEISLFGQRDVAPVDERFSEERAASRPNQIRDRGRRDDLESTRMASRDRNPSYGDDRDVPAYADAMHERAQRVKTLGATLPPAQPSSIAARIQRNASDPRRNISADPSQGVAPPLGSNDGVRPSYSEGPFPPGGIGLPPERAPFKKNFTVNTAKIERDNVQEPSRVNDNQGYPPGRFDTPKSQTSPTDSRLLPVTVLLGLLSLGANFFLGWQVFGWYMRYRDVIDQVRMGSSWSNETRTPAI